MGWQNESQSACNQGVTMLFDRPDLETNSMCTRTVHCVTFDV